MTYQRQNSAIQAVMELVTETGFEGMGEAFQIILNEAMRLERSRHLQATPYERCEERQGHDAPRAPVRHR